MSIEYSTIIGSGTQPHLASSPPYAIPDGTFPIPSKSASLRGRMGEGVVVVNPEDFSVSIGVRSSAITVTTSATPLPDSPLEFRRALAIHNNGASTVFLGDESVTTSNGFPLLAGEKISFDISGTPNVFIYAIAAGSVNVRILELS